MVVFLMINYEMARMKDGAQFYSDATKKMMTSLAFTDCFVPIIAFIKFLRVIWMVPFPHFEKRRSKRELHFIRGLASRSMGKGIRWTLIISRGLTSVEYIYQRIGIDCGDLIFMS